MKFYLSAFILCTGLVRGDWGAGVGVGVGEGGGAGGDGGAEERREN